MRLDTNMIVARTIRTAEGLARVVSIATTFTTTTTKKTTTV